MAHLIELHCVDNGFGALQNHGIIFYELIVNLGASTTIKIRYTFSEPRFRLQT